MAGYIVLGIGFGILLQNAGYSWLYAVVMSIAIYAGSMQYVAVELLAGGASLAAAALMTFLLISDICFMVFLCLSLIKIQA